MYHNEPPLRVRPADVDAAAACPASAGPGSKLTRAPLDRWIAVKDALEAALGNQGDVDKAVNDNAAWLDDVQRDIVADLVANGVAMLGASDATIEFDPEDNVVTIDHPTRNVELASHFQILVTDPNDPANVEYFKIRTGRQGTPPSEAAVVVAGGAAGVGYADLMLTEGTIEPIELSSSEAEEAISRLYALAGGESDRRDRRPGWQCYLCDRVATCGQYPAPAGYKVGRRQRTIRVSKSDVLRFDECHRRLAWKVIHTIPKEIEGEPGAAAATGLLFHEILAEVVLSSDPDGTFSDLVGRVSPEDREAMERLYERHKQIEKDHIPVSYGRTEYPVGATFIVDGLDSDRDGNVKPGVSVAVTVIARTDAVGREPDDTPAVIEHRTGKTSDRIDERETALYAVSTARLLRVDTVAVHQHSLGADGDPECIRVLYGPDELAAAEAMLKEVVAPIASWSPVDAMDPPFSVGDWCTECPYQQRCARFR